MPDLSNAPRLPKAKVSSASPLPSTSTAPRLNGFNKGVNIPIPSADVSPVVTNLTVTEDFNNIYRYVGGNEKFVSRYPMYYPNVDNESMYGRQQTGGQVFSNMAKQFWTTGYSSFLNYFNQTANNLESLSSMDIKSAWDSEMAALLASKSNSAFDKYPIYTTAEMAAYDQRAKELPQVIGKYFGAAPNTGRYWAQLGGQLGFTTGTVAAAYLEQVIISKVAPQLNIKLPKALHAVYKSVYQLGKTQQSFSKMKKLATVYKALDKGAKGGGYFLRMANLATGEAAIEANMAKIDFVGQQLQEADEKMGWGALSQVDEIGQAANKVGDFTFAANVGILTATKLIQIPALFKPKFMTKSIGREVASNLVAKNGMFTTSKELAKGFWKKAGLKSMNVVKRVGSPFAVSEGVEELSQGLGSRTAQRYYDVIDSDYGKSNTELLRAFGDEFSHTFDTGEGWNEFVSGLMIGGGINILKGVASSVFNKDQQKAKDLADQLNKGVSDLIAHTLLGVNMTTLNSATSINYSTEEALSKGNVKIAKDLETESQNLFFEKAYRTGLGSEMIDNVVEGLKDVVDKSGKTEQEVLGGRTISEIEQDLRQKQDAWINKREEYDLIFSSEGLKGDSLAAFEAAKTELTNMDAHLNDTIGRVNNLKEELKAKAEAGGETALRAYELLEAISNPPKFDETINTLEEKIRLTEQNLKDSVLSEEANKATKEELERDKKWVKELRKVKDSIVDSDGNYTSKSPEQIAKTAFGTLQELDPAGYRKDTQMLLRDLVELEREGSELLTTLNILSDEKYLNKFAEGYKKALEKKRNQIKSRIQKANPTTQTQQSEDNLSPSQDVSQQSYESAQEEYANVEQEEGKFTYNGEVFDTLEEAYAAVRKNIDPEVAGNKAATDKLEKQRTDQINGVTTTGAVAETIVSDKVYNKFLKDGIESVPEDVIRKIIEKLPTLSPREQAILDADMQRGDESVLKKVSDEIKSKATKAAALPKTNKDVRGNPQSTIPESKTNTLTHFFDLAVASFMTLSEYLKSQKKVSVDPVVKKALLPFKGGYHVVTIHMNDTVINSNVREGEQITEEQIREDLSQEGVAVLKDNRSRLVVVIPKETSGEVKEQGARNAIKLMKEKFGLDVELTPKLGFTFIRQNGQLISATFEQENFDDSAKDELNKLGGKDKVEVVIVDNAYNRQVAQEYHDKLTKINKSKDSEKKKQVRRQKAFDAVVQQLALDIKSNGKTVGRIRAGDYFVQDSGVTDKITEFRQNVISQQAFLDFDSATGDMTLGTVQADTIVAVRNNQTNEKGELVFTSLEDYEKSHKQDPNSDFKVDYFVATDEHTIENKKGKRIGSTQINRKQPFKQGAVYVEIKNGSGVVMYLQATREEATTYTLEDLKKNDFKKELYVALKPAQRPYVSKRVYVDRSSFEAGGQPQNHVETIEDSLKQDVQDGAVKVNGKEYTDVEVDYDTKNLYGTNSAGERVVIPFRKISSTDKFVPQQDEEQTEDQDPSVEQLSFEDTPVDQKQQWIIDNGQEGETYELPDGTKITVVEKTADKLTLSWEVNGKSIPIHLDLNTQQTIDFETEQLRFNLEQAADPKNKYNEEYDEYRVTDAELYEILKKQGVNLTLREQLVSKIHQGRLASLASRIENNLSYIEGNADQFLSFFSQLMISEVLGEPFNNFVVKLVETFRQARIDGQPIETMSELLEKAGYADKEADLAELLSFADYGALFLYVSQADKIYGFSQLASIRYNMTYDLPQILELIQYFEAMDFEGTPEEVLEEELEKATQTLKKLLGRQTLFVEGNLSGLDKQSTVEALRAFETLFRAAAESTDNTRLTEAFLEANDQLRPMEIQIHLDGLVTTVEGNGFAKDLVINNDYEFYQEFDDLVMAQKAQDRISAERNFTGIYVKDEQGGMQEVKLDELDLTSPMVVQEKQILDELLKPFGISINIEYLAGYIKVNGTATGMVNRIAERVPQVREIKDFQNLIHTGTSQTVTKYYNENQATEQVEENTCD